MDIKVNTLSQNATGVSTSGFLASLFPANRGTNSINEFVGNRIDPVNLTVRWAFTYADATNRVRFSIFQLLGGGTATLANFYVSPTFVDSPINNNPTLPFRTLYDRYLGVNAEDATFACGTIQVHTAFISGKRMVPLVFPSGAFVGPSSGVIVIAAISDSLAPPNPNLTFYAQMKFTDI